MAGKMGERGSTALSLLSPRMIFTLFSYTKRLFTTISEPGTGWPTTIVSSLLQIAHVVHKEKILFLSYIKSSTGQACLVKMAQWLFFLLLLLFSFLVTSTLSCCIKMHNKKEKKKSQQIHVYMYSHFYQVILTSCLVNNVNLIVVYRQLVLF